MNEIIVGVDRSATAHRAAVRAAELAAQTDADLHIVMCIKRSSAGTAGSGQDSWHIDPVSDAENFLRDLGASLHYDRITTSVQSGDPASAMCDEAERLDAGMIVVGNRRVQGVSRVLGSIAGEVLKHAPCDVLIANTTG